MFAGDPCDGITECETLGSACDGPDLVTCETDAFGCQVESRTTCTDEMFGFCDEPTAMCSTAAVDPCMGMVLCDPEGVSCMDDTRAVCTANAFGCLVETTTDCAAATDMCNVGSCDADTGDCLVTPVADATVCDDGDPDTTGEACYGGTCRVACTVTFISQADQANSANIAPLFTAVGAVMTPFVGNGGTGVHSSLPATYAGADVAIFHINNRLLNDEEFAALNGYLDGGGVLLVTGYDSIGSPTDARLAGLMGCGTGGDGPFSGGTTVTNASHPIAMGPAQTFTMDQALTAANTDHDTCRPDAAATQIVGFPGGQSKLQILPHAGGGAVMYWNGNDTFGTTDLADWEGTSGTQPDWQNLFVNTLTHLCGL